MSDCRICQTPDKDKPMIFRNTDWCCENHRKVGLGELPASIGEAQLMDKDMLNYLTVTGKLEHIRGF